MLGALVMLVEALAAAGILGACGLIGLLGSVSGAHPKESPLGVTSVICLVGGFMELFNAWLWR